MKIEEHAERLRAWMDLHLFSVAGTTISVATLCVFGAVVLATFALSKLARRAAERALRRRHVEDEGTIAVTQRLLHYVIVALGLGTALHTMGIDLTALFAAGAFFAVAVGFAMQNVAQNFVSGIILLVERRITPGDVLHFDGKFVLVEKLGVRTTIVRTLNDEDVIVPNSELIQSTVTNHTLRDNLLRIRTRVGVAYESDLKLVRQTLLEAAASVPQRVQSKNPVAMLHEFGDHAVIYDVSIWIEHPWRSAVGRADLNEAIWWALKERGITIAFQQLDVHLDPPVTRALSRQREIA